MSKPNQETLQDIEAQLNRSYSLVHWNRPVHYDPSCDLDDSRPTQPMGEVAARVTKGVK